MKRLFERVLVIVPMLWLMLALPALGATITVTRNVDSGSGTLRNAITSASNGDTIVFDLGGNDTIELSSPLTIDKNLAIDGASTPSLAISGNGAQVFVVNTGVTVAFANLSITNGFARDGSGGAINNKGALTLINSTISENGADISGGGIYNDISGDATLIGSTLYCNGVQTAGAIGGGGIHNRGILKVANSTFTCNIAHDSNGAGLYNDVSAVATVTNSTFVGNLTAGTGPNGGRGGGIYNLGVIVQLTNSTISTNYAGIDGAGGGIYNAGTIRALTNSTLSGNSSAVVPGGSVPAGVGIYNVGSAVPLVNAIVDDCLGSIADNGGNLDSGSSCGLSMASSKSNATLNLGLVTYNGGATATILPGAGSDALGHGIPSACTAAPINGLDQRGATRSAANCTSGAVEAGGFFTLDVSVTGNGNVSDGATPSQIQCTAVGSTCNAHYLADPQGFASVTLTARADSGNYFTGWSGDCANANSASDVTVTMNINRACTAIFATVAGVSMAAPTLDRWALWLLTALAALVALKHLPKYSRWKHFEQESVLPNRVHQCWQRGQ